jgi:predicted negative regulator of RcsB-dependent stress response
MNNITGGSVHSYQTDDEQLERLKAWWKQYGRYVVYGLVLGGLVVAGVNYWRDFKATRAESASGLYQGMMTAYQAKKTDTAKSEATKLVNDYAGTPYAGKAALLLAKIAFDAGDRTGARTQLSWAMDHATEAAVRHAARLRLGHLMLDQGDVDQALALAEVKDQDGFESQYQELRGDVFVKKGRVAEARTAYRRALETLPAGSPYAQVLSMKFDDLGAEQSG